MGWTWAKHQGPHFHTHCNSYCLHQISTIGPALTTLSCKTESLGKLNPSNPTIFWNIHQCSPFYGCGVSVFLDNKEVKKAGKSSHRMIVRCVVLLLSYSHACSYKHTTNSWDWVTSLKCPQCSRATCAQTHKIFGESGCGKDVKREWIPDTLLQLASLHMHLMHAQTHARTHTHALSLPSNLCVHQPDAASKIWLQRPALCRVSWYTSRGRKTRRHTGQDTKHQHHLNPSLLKGSNSSHL